MGLTFPGFKYLPIPDEINREKMNMMGITITPKNEDINEIEYSLPFGWDIGRSIGKNEFYIFDWKCKLRVAIINGRYEIIEKESDMETELK